MTKTRSILQLSVVVALAIGAGACQTISDLDPTGLIGGSSSDSPDSQFPVAGAPASNDAAQNTPDLASLPARPDAPPTATAQQTTQSVTADGAQARYSADALRGGTEAAAPAPGTANSAPLPQAVASNAPPSADAPPTTDAAPITTNALPTAQMSAPQGNAAVPTAGRTAAPVQTASAAPMPASVPSAPPPGAEPAVPANTPFRGSAGSAVASDAALGFQASSAPPLNASITQWVPAPIIAHYRQTASNAGVATANPAAAVPQRGAGMQMSNSVVANLGAIPSGPASVAAVDGGVAPTAVVYFPGDGTSLSGAARTEIRNAAQAFKAGGGAGTIRVIGHASSRTANMPVEKHLELIFNKSQARANAVAQELIHEGVPADKVLVEAVGDSQPVYYKSMPKGEDGNRRADIFVQS